jgi:hypothetical protein
MSWKKYGGLKNLENFNNVTINNIVTDTFTVRDAIINLLRIEGDLLVNGFVTVRDDVRINGNIFVNSIIGANLVVFDIINIREGHVSGNLFVSQNVSISENLSVSGNIFLDPAKDTFIYGKNHKFGINTNNLTATLDISGIHNESINVWTTQSINKNILSRNRDNQGIVLLSDTSGAYVEFFTETAIPMSNNNIVPHDFNYVADASMSYFKGGILELNTKNDVKISTNMIVNKKNSNGHLLQESAIIYDIPAGTYFYNCYQQSTIKTGNALTLLSNDNSSNTFLNITNPNKQGGAFGGGAYINDLSRNMAIIGVLDASGTLTPHQMIVSGNSTVINKATVGFNTFSPSVDKYVVDINGPLKITNGEITTIAEPIIQIINTGFPKNRNYSNFMTIVGTPYPQSIDASNNNLYYVWNSLTGGKTWIQSTLSNIDSALNINMYGAFAYNNNFRVISGSLNTLMYSLNGGLNWGSIGGFDIGNRTLYSTVITDYNTTQRFFVAYHNNFFYFDATVSFITNPNTYTITSYTIVSTTVPASPVVTCDVSGDYFYIAGGTLIKIFRISTLSSTAMPLFIHTISGGSYNSISVYSESYAVAVGTNIISYTLNGGSSWIDLITTGITFNSVYVYDMTNAIAVGNSGTLYYTNNGSVTWQVVPSAILNTSGVASIILDPTHNLSSVYMPNINTLIVSSVVLNFVNPNIYGKSKIFYVHVPNLFNITNGSNSVVDICGNMALTGSIVLSGQINQF